MATDLVELGQTLSGEFSLGTNIYKGKNTLIVYYFKVDGNCYDFTVGPPAPEKSSAWWWSVDGSYLYTMPKESTARQIAIQIAKSIEDEVLRDES